MLASGVAGNGPAFSAYRNAGQALTASTYTKLQINTDEYDTASCYDNTTNRFLLMNIRTGISVFCHNTLEELCSDSITSEALNVDIHTKIKLGDNYT